MEFEAAQQGIDMNWGRERRAFPLMTRHKNRTNDRNVSRDEDRNVSNPFASKFWPGRNEKCRRWKSLVYSFLEDSRTFSSKLYHYSVIILILLSLALAIVLSIKGVAGKQQNILHIALPTVEIVLALVFSAEYGLRLWSCSARGTYAGIRGLTRYMLRPHMVLDLIVILCSLTLASLTLGYYPGWKKLRHVMPLQLFRILRIDRQRGAFITFRAVIRNHIKELLTCWYMGFIVVMFLSYFVYAEPTPDGADDTTVNNLANSLYWGIVSMTTMGYGDIVPKTALAKLVLCIFAVVGTGFIALPAGIIGSGFALQVIEEKKRKQNKKRRRPAAVLIQSAWRLWASDLSKHFQATWIPHTTVVKELKDGELPALFSATTNTFHSSLPGTNLRYQQIRQSPHSTRKAEGHYVVYRELSTSQKIAIGFIRHLKFVVAQKYFRQTRRAFDEKDIMDQFTSGQVEISHHLKVLDRKVENLIEHRGNLEERVTSLQRERFTMSSISLAVSTDQVRKIASRQEHLIASIEKLILEVSDKNSGDKKS